ncbi:hypothetical protein HHI36_023529 [Cryptolaemus montrouzieri]|uniref:Uncharacterized protein n=1 Tax=Cryptolaemus montrouzieri TaxID=559131 RepID=A0ABD2PH11_9CUCU
MDEIFSKKPWCNPVVVASSSGLSKIQVPENIQKKRTKSPKVDVKSLSHKRLYQREEHEAAKAKRHKERIEMDNKFLTMLEKLVEKKIVLYDDTFWLHSTYSSFLFVFIYIL